MILDKGFCSIYEVANSAPAGGMPVEKLTLKYQSWYGELDFSTTPYQAEMQEDVEISARVRIVQNRSIQPRVYILSNVLSPPVARSSTVSCGRTTAQMTRTASPSPICH